MNLLLALDQENQIYLYALMQMLPLRQPEKKQPGTTFKYSEKPSLAVIIFENNSPRVP